MNRKSRFIAAQIMSLILICTQGKSVFAEAWFPYSTSWKDNVEDTTFNNETTEVAVDGSAFLDAPAGKYGFVKADGEHFTFENGKRIKFWGTNLTFGACFPTHENAEVLARQLAKCGFNAVRFHHMDSQYAPKGLIDKNTQKLSAEQLDRLDYLIYQLKLNGIYSDLNLHVGRNYSGIKEVADNNMLPRNSKGVTLFDDAIIGLEKDYANELLTHENKYTNTKYNEEPAICFIEIANEDSLFTHWTSGAIFGQGVKGNEDNNFTQYYIDELDKKWNDYLKNKYGTEQQLEAAWSIKPSKSLELVQNGGFEENFDKPWNLEKHQGITAKVSRDENDKVSGNYSLRVEADNIDEANAYKLQLKQLGIKVEKGKKYKLQFYSKADTERNINISFGRDVAPYNNYGLSAQVPLTTLWKKYTYYFNVNETTDDLTRLAFVLGSVQGKFWIDDVSMSEDSGQGVIEGEALDKGNISRTKWNERYMFSDQRLNDNIEFYYEVEKDFYSDMISYLHNDLNIKVPISTTNSYYGQPNLLVRQEGDYIDAHSYWDHAVFPNKPWDRMDFKHNNISAIGNNVRNKSSIGDSFLDRFASSATKGKPMVVSEWNYVFPNDYEYEGPNMLTAYASTQDYDGLFIYEYMASEAGEMYLNNNSSDYINSWFDIAYNPGKKAQMLQNAIAFYRGDINSDNKEIDINYTDEFAKNSFKDHGSNEDYLPDGSKLPNYAFYNYKIRKNFNQTSNSKLSDLLSKDELDKLKNEKSHINDTGEITWNGETTNKEYISVNTPKYQSLTGFIAGSEFKLQNLTAKAAENCAIGLISLDNNSLSNSARMLLTVVAKQKNTEQKKTEVNGLSDWGKSPVLMEKVDGIVSITQDYVEGAGYKVYVLNNKGERVQQKDITTNIDKSNKKEIITFELGDSALWYEVIKK